MRRAQSTPLGHPLLGDRNLLRARTYWRPPRDAIAPLAVWLVGQVMRSGIVPRLIIFGPACVKGAQANSGIIRNLFAEQKRRLGIRTGTPSTLSRSALLGRGETRIAKSEMSLSSSASMLVLVLLLLLSMPKLDDPLVFVPVLVGMRRGRSLFLSLFFLVIGRAKRHRELLQLLPLCHFTLTRK